MDTFDQSAAAWDSNPLHWERSKAIARMIRQKINLNPTMMAMEYGAGTGILSFLLKDSLKEIILMDNSIEMVKVMEEKVKSAQASHLKPVFFNLETGDYAEQTFDLIFSQMVMHHVSDVKSIIKSFHALLNDKGKLVIADLYAEDGSFHGDGFTGHLGFDVENLAMLIREAGFENISHEQCFVVKKQTEKYGTREFPVFILTAVKRA